jgi:hypothetical protein
MVAQFTNFIQSSNGAHLFTPFCLVKDLKEDRMNVSVPRRFGMFWIGFICFNGL